MLADGYRSAKQGYTAGFHQFSNPADNADAWLSNVQSVLGGLWPNMPESELRELIKTISQTPRAGEHVLSNPVMVANMNALHAFCPNLSDLQPPASEIGY